jgi:hypothetical protein
MSYCTTARLAAQARVRDLQERVKEAQTSGQELVLLDRLKREIEQAVTAVVATGDCGD